MLRTLTDYLLGLIWLWFAGRQAEAVARYRTERRWRVARWYLLGVVLAFVAGVGYMVLGERANYIVAAMLAWLCATIAFEMFDVQRLMRLHRARMALYQQQIEDVERKIDE